MMMRLTSCLIVGAGICGLTAARRLKDHGVRVTVVEKGRGVGGRMANRRIGEGSCDHGAQFLTASTGAFRRMVEEWENRGIVIRWAEAFPDSEGRLPPEMLPRYRCHPSMTAVPKHLAQGVDIRLGERALRATPGPRDWEVITDRGVTFTAEALILTSPVPQSLSLFESQNIPFDREIYLRLRSIQYHPCMAALLLLEGESNVPSPGGLHVSSGPLRWAADNRQKGVSPVTTLTLHAEAEFSSRNFEMQDQEVFAAMSSAAAGLIPGGVIEWQIHRWRYSEPKTPGAVQTLLAHMDPPLVFAGDAFEGARIEGAALSGLRAAELLIELIDN